MIPCRKFGITLAMFGAFVKKMLRYSSFSHLKRVHKSQTWFIGTFGNKVMPAIVYLRMFTLNDTYEPTNMIIHPYLYQYMKMYAKRYLLDDNFSKTRPTNLFTLVKTSYARQDL